MQGTEGLTQFLKINPNLNIIALTMHDSKDIILDMVKRGAKGYILKDTPMEELITAIKTVRKGEIYFPPKISQVLFDEYKRSFKSNLNMNGSDKLSDREMEVLKCIVNGMSNKEIADKLYLSIRTVETHRYNIKRKLNINSVAGLTRYAMDEGILN
jgi:Response regulator containing a CheY-like receiver domain and an HTH DNA-binding domain